MTNNRYWLYLEQLRRDGRTNMYGAVPYLMEYFDMDKKYAAQVLAEWMKNYNPDDYLEEIDIELD